MLISNKLALSTNSSAVNLYKLLGLKGIKVNINSLGDKESRDAIHKAIRCGTLMMRSMVKTSGHLLA